MVRTRTQSRGRTPTGRRNPSPFNTGLSMLGSLANSPLAYELASRAGSAAGRLARSMSRSPARIIAPATPSANQRRTLSQRSQRAGTLAAGRTTRHVGRKRITKRVKSPKRKRIVKVSKSLRAKINTVLDGKYYKGVYNSVTFNSGFNEVSNQQKSTRLQQHANTATALFDWNQILDAASILWNGKPGAEGPLIGDSTNLPTLNTHVFVRECHAEIIIRNNSHRTYWVLAHKSVPKSETTNYSDPITHWVDCLAQEASEKINVSSSILTQTYLRPTQCPSWNKYWKDEITEFCIEPGQSVVYNVPGPRNFKKEYEKRLVGTNIPLVDKDAVYVWFTHWIDVEPSVLSSVPTGAARWGDAKITDGHALCWEIKKRIKLAIPENVGFTATSTAGAITQLGGIPVAGTSSYNIPLNLKHEAYYYATYGGVGNPGNAGITAGLRVDEEQPANDVVIG